MTKPDVTIVLTAHREGLLAGVSAQSLIASREHAEAAGLVCETLVLLDRADDLTAETVKGALGSSARYLETAFGDPGVARNHGVAEAAGTFATFLDGDDLWSRNWITQAVALARQRPDAIAHSQCNVFFGGSNGIWWHVDSESPLCDPFYLRWMNYWDAMTLASTDLYREYPFCRNDLARGYGHEDWHWNIVTLGRGVAHKPVPETVHFKRRRKGTQSDLVERSGGVPFPVPDAVLDPSAFDALRAAARKGA